MKKIVIVGGGTAGASALALLQEKLAHLAQIVLIDSEDVPPVGVGEGTLAPIGGFLSMCGLHPDQVCLGTAEGTIKYAVRLKDWYKQDHCYFTPIGLIGMEYHDYLKYRRPEKEYWDSWTGLRLGLNGKSPFLRPEFADASLIPTVWPEYAYNVDAGAFAGVLLEAALRKGATRIRKTIRHVVPADHDTVSHLILEDGQRVEADFYIDCSGFQSLIPTALNCTKTRFKEIPNDRAWATRIPYLDRSRELPYLAVTESQTMSAGWRWQIGLRHRIGTGYVFSSNHQSEEDALREFVDSFPVGRIDPVACRLIKFDTACYGRQAGSNWITSGLSAGFVEPLEATSIFFIHNNLVAFLSLAQPGRRPDDTPPLSMSVWDVALRSGKLDGWFHWDQRNVDLFNAYTYKTFQTTVDYIAAHYALSTLDRSEYWKEWRGQRDKYIDVTSNALGHAYEHFIFSRPAFCLLSVGNRLGAIENWDLSRLSVIPRQERRFRSGELTGARAIIGDRTREESLAIEQEYLGILQHRSYMADRFAEHAYDLIDQHECLARIDE